MKIGAYTELIGARRQANLIYQLCIMLAYIIARVVQSLNASF